jgi:ubiquitin-protein ligase
MAQVRLNQRVKTQVDELKSLTMNDDHTPVIFILDNVLFNVDEVIDFTDSIERTIVGRILPTSDIFKQGAFQIEIKLPSIYPLNPPTVRFITPIYHPNVGNNGK